MPIVSPGQAQRTFEFQIMHPTFEDAPIPLEDGDVVPGLRHVASYFYEGTKADTIGNMLPVVLAASKNGWSEDKKTFLPWFNDPNIKLTPYAMSIINEVGGMRSLRKGDAVRLVGTGYEEQGDDVSFYDTEGKKIATYIFDGEGFRTTYRRLVVSHAITLDEPKDEEEQPAPEQADEVKAEEPASTDEVKDSGEAPAATEATDGSSTEGGLKVGDEIEATSSTEGVPPLRGTVTKVEKDTVTIEDADGKEHVLKLPPTQPRLPVPPPPPPKPSGMPPMLPSAAADDDEEDEEPRLWDVATYEELKNGETVMVYIQGADDPVVGTVAEKDPEGMFIKPEKGGLAAPVLKINIVTILREKKAEENPSPAAGAAAEAPVAPPPSVEQPAE